MISISDLYFAYPGRKELFGGLCLHLERHENVLLTGANGCGKSTLLKLIVGLLSPEKGHIRLAGKPVKGLSAELCSAIIYHSQHTDENLLGINPQQDWDIWKLALPQLPELQDSNEVLFSEHSSGMLKQYSQRILPYVPDKYWILDEPFTALDAQASAAMWELLRQKSQNHPGMLIVSHEFGHNEAEFQRILSLQQGRIREVQP